jgi:hypothetical protein
MADQQTRATGARPVGSAPPRRPWWLWVVLALIAIALLVLGLVRCGASGGNGQDPSGASVVPSTPAAAPGDGAGASAAPSAGTAPPAGASTAPGAGTADGSGAGAGTLTAGGTALLPLSGAAGPDAALTALVGRPVTGQAVTVQSVPSDEGFWIGTSETDRVWVALTVPAGESPYQVRPGQTVDLSGTVAAHDAGFAQQQGVDAAEGADQLTRQAAHLAVMKADLRILAS